MVGRPALVMSVVGLAAVAITILILMNGLSGPQLVELPPNSPSHPVQIGPGSLTLNFDPRTIRQPRGGEIRFKLGNLNTYDFNISVYFRWWTKGNEQVWIRAPSIRLVSMDNEIVSIPPGTAAFQRSPDLA